MIRLPAVAGQFYEGNARALKRQVEDCIDAGAKKVDAIGAMCPHAGLMYSGKVAAAVWGRMVMPDTIVLIGPNHHGLGPDFGIMTEGAWRTPLGDVRVDSDVAREVYKRSRHLEVDQFSQQREHSLEVQLPFIQYFSPSCQIVPISMKHYEADDSFLRICEAIGEGVAKGLDAVKSKVMVVASSDMSHYEPQKTAQSNDQAALDAIVALDGKRLFREVRERGISMCGYAAVAAMMASSRLRGAKGAQLVKYMTSGDSTGDYSQVVGYGGVLVTP
jgi:MEMO1 family protein